MIKLKDIILKGANYIGGNPSKNGDDIFYAINPRTGEKSELAYYEATKDEIGKACKLAHSAFNILRKTTNEERAKFLEIVSEEIMNLGDQLLEIADWEVALGLQRFTGERVRTCNQIKMFADYIREGKHEETIIDEEDPQTKLKRMLIPIGPVAVFGVSNFPLAFGVCGGDTVSALAAGCPVVAKGHPSHPQTSELFAVAMNKAIERAGFPKGTFSLLQGVKNITGKNLVLHSAIKAVGFTGSRGGGDSLFDLAASRTNPIPVYAEMGSINPVFITKSAINTRADKMAQEFADSITLGVGQFCTKPGVFFLPAFEGSIRFIKKIAEIMNGKKNQSLLNGNVYKSLVKMMEETQSLEGVELLIGGKIADQNFAFQNTLLKTDLSTYLKEERLKMEYFGPLALFVECDSQDQYLEVVDQLDGQLTGTIYLEKEDYKAIKPLFNCLKEKVGRLIINGVPTGVKVSPAMNHGGPYPATTAVRTTSVGMTAIQRFLRPICYQNVPEDLLCDNTK